MDEQVIIVNENNDEIGSCGRSRMRKENLWHRSSFIFVVNSNGQFFVQKRTSTKDYCPSYFDLAAGGVVKFGESMDEV